jgi:hypothetical protein
MPRKFHTRMYRDRIRQVNPNIAKKETLANISAECGHYYVSLAKDYQRKGNESQAEIYFRIARREFANARKLRRGSSS